MLRGRRRPSHPSRPPEAAADILTKPLAREPYHRRRTRLFGTSVQGRNDFFFLCACMASIEDSALASKQRVVSWEEGGLPMANFTSHRDRASGVLESVWIGGGE